jgi:hypothetical protein
LIETLLGLPSGQWVMKPNRTDLFIMTIPVVVGRLRVGSSTLALQAVPIAQAFACANCASFCTGLKPPTEASIFCHCI